MKSLKIKHCIKSISSLVLYLERFFSDDPYWQQNHIQYDLQELYCDNSDKYFTQLSNMKYHEKDVSDVKNVIMTSSI